MRIILGTIVAALVAWTGWWFFAAGRIEQGTEGFLADMTGEGFDVRHGGVDVSGYPYRFDLVVTAPEVASPGGGLAWAAPEVRLQALAYAPSNIIATLPGRQALTVGDTVFDVTSRRMQANLRADLSPRLPLDHMTLEAEGLGIAADAGWALTAEKAIFATRRSQMTGAGPNAHDMVLTVADFVPDPALRARMDPASGMVASIGPLKLDATVTLDAPVDRMVFQAGARLPELTRLDLREGSLVWGESRIGVSGALDFGPTGLAEGTLQLKVTGWKDILRLAVSLGLVPEGQQRTVERVMRLMEATRFGPETLDLNLPVEDGVVLLGPLPVATLPSAFRSTGG